jgi:hypothetical protein
MFTVDFSDTNNLQSRATIWTKGSAHKCDRTTCAIKQWRASLLAGWNEFGRREISGQPVESERDLLITLNLEQTVVPVW